MIKSKYSPFIHSFNISSSIFFYTFHLMAHSTLNNVDDDVLLAPSFVEFHLFLPPSSIVQLPKPLNILLLIRIFSFIFTQRNSLRLIMYFVHCGKLAAYHQKEFIMINNNILVFCRLAWSNRSSIYSYILHYFNRNLSVKCNLVAPELWKVRSVVNNVYVSSFGLQLHYMLRLISSHHSCDTMRSKWNCYLSS